MIIDVVYSYGAFIRRRKKRKADDKATQYLATFPAEVREASSDAAPIAMWWRSPSHDGLTTVAMRTFEGALYEPVFLKDMQDKLSGKGPGKTGHAKGRESWRLMSGEDLVQAMKSELSGSPAKPMWSPIPADHRPIDDDVTVAEVVSSGKAGLETQYRTWLAALMLVDGVVYRQVPPPMWVIEEKESHNAMEASLDYAKEDETYWSPPCHQVYPASEFEAFWERYNGGEPHFGWKRDKKDFKPEILIPEALDFNPAKWMVKAMAREAVYWLSSTKNSRSYSRETPVLASMPKAMMRAFVDLRSGKDSDDVEMQAVRLQAVLDAHGPRDYRTASLMKRMATLMDRLRQDGYIASPETVDLATLDVRM